MEIKDWKKELRKIIFQHSDIYSETDPSDLIYVDMIVNDIISLVPSQRKEIEEIKNRIGWLRQWINEKPKDLLVTNEMIEVWLFDDSKLKEK